MRTAWHGPSAQIGESAVRPRRVPPASHRHRKRTPLNSKYRGARIAVAESLQNRRPTMAAAALLLPPRLVSLPSSPSLVPSFKNPAPSFAPRGRRGARARLRAVGDRPGAGLADQTTVYNGVYGPWTVEDSDVREVQYRNTHRPRR